jgi:hypothetical protein
MNPRGLPHFEATTERSNPTANRQIVSQEERDANPGPMRVTILATHPYPPITRISVKTKELGRSFLASVSKQRTYKGVYAHDAE